MMSDCVLTGDPDDKYIMKCVFDCERQLTRLIEDLKPGCVRVKVHIQYNFRDWGVHHDFK